MGQARVSTPEEQGWVTGQEPAAPVRAVVVADAYGGGHDRVPCGPGRFEALPEGEQELLGWPVSVLRVLRPAAHQQRPGARLRQPPLPRASCQWSASCVAGSGGAGLGTADLECGDAAAARRGTEATIGLRAELAGTARAVGAAARVPAQATPLSP